MANYSRGDDTRNERRAPSTETPAEVEQDLALGLDDPLHFSEQLRWEDHLARVALEP